LVLPASLHEATIAAAAGCAAISPRIEALVRGVAAASVEQGKALGSLVAVAVLLAGTALAATGISATDPDEPSQPRKPAKVQAEPTTRGDRAGGARMAATPVAREGTVVDGNGRPLSGVAVFLSVWGGREPDGTSRALERATTDEQGHFRMAVPPRSA